MSRIEAVTFSEFILFEELTHFTIPANDPIPLYGMAFQSNEPGNAPPVDPAAVVDPLGATTHLYSNCYAGWGRWEIQQVMVTNANPYLVYWCLYKFPPATYKDTGTHNFIRYTGAAYQAADAVDVRMHCLFYSIPLAPFQTFVTPMGFRSIMQAGESLWGCVNPGWKWSARAPTLPATPTVMTTMRVTGDIVV